jgi:hypothetical protein
MRGLCTKALEIVMDHPVWPDLPLPMSLHPDAVPAAEAPVLRYPAAPWLHGLDELEQGPVSDAVLPDGSGEQVPVESRSGTGAIACASAESSAHNGAPLDQADRGQVREVALWQIRLRQAHRRIVTDARSLEALISSINAIELRRPLLVRPVGHGLYELVTGHRRYTALQADGRETAMVEIREMTALDAALHAYADDHYHIRRRFWERALRIEEIRALVAVERGVPASDVTNRIILARLGIRQGDRSQDSLVSECLGALVVLTPEVLALAGVERDDPRVARGVSRPVYRKIRNAADDRARAAILYHAVHGHQPAWAPEAEANGGFDAASVISTRATLISVVMEIAWARVPPEHVRAVRRRARAELHRLLREPPVRLSLPVLTARAGEPGTQPD